MYCSFSIYRCKSDRFKMLKVVTICSTFYLSTDRRKNCSNKKKNKPKIFDKRKTLFRICRSINCLSSSSNNFPIKLNSLFEFNDIKCAEKLVKCQFCMCMWCVKKSTNVFSIYKKKAFLYVLWQMLKVNFTINVTCLT